MGTVDVEWQEEFARFVNPPGIRVPTYISEIEIDMQQKSILTLTKDIRFEGYVLVRMSEQRTGSTGSKYLDLTLADCTGELNGKLWDGNVDPPPVGSVLKVRGVTQESNGRLQLRIEKMRPVAETDKVDMNLLTPSAPESPENMLSEITEAVEKMQRIPLRSIVQALLKRYQDKFSFSPRRSAYTMRNAAACRTIRWGCSGSRRPCFRFIPCSTRTC